jgi:hypothetical protein
MSASISAIQLRGEAAQIGWLLGNKQAQEHSRLTGANRLTGKHLRAFAQLAWKYEGSRVCDSDPDRHAFIDAYTLAYRSYRG